LALSTLTLHTPQSLQIMAQLEAIAQTPLFQRRSGDHVAHAACFNSHLYLASFFKGKLAPGKELPMIATEAVMRSKAPPVALFVTPFSTDLPVNSTDVSAQRRDIGIFFGGSSNGRFDDNLFDPTAAGKTRAGYKQRWNLFKFRSSMPKGTVLVTSGTPTKSLGAPFNSSSSNYTGAFINESAFIMMPECPDLNHVSCMQCRGRYEPDIQLRAEFTVAPRGDNPTSPRIYEGPAFGAIPVIISDDIYKYAMPFQCLVPYNSFSLQVPEAACNTNCGIALSNAVNISQAAKDRKRELLKHFQRDLLWDIPGSRVAENILLDMAQWRVSQGASHLNLTCPLGNKLQSMNNAPSPGELVGCKVITDPIINATEEDAARGAGPC